MSNEILITIGIASYNYSRFLPRAFEAIKRQKFTDFELLYSDDGSTDDSVQVIKKFIADNPNMTIRLIENENGGVMVNKNRILDNAYGKYVMLCDADDWMDDDCLELLAAEAKKTNADRVIAGFRNVVKKGDSLQIGQVENLSANPSKWNQFEHHGCLYKVSTYRDNNIRFRPDHYPDDFDFIERFNVCSSSVAFIDAVVYNYYHDGSSASATMSKDSRWYFINMFQDIMNLTEELLPLLGKEDYWELQATVMRIYFAFIMKTESNVDYLKLRCSLIKVMPDYQKNPLLYKVKDSPFRPSTARKAIVLMKLDKISLLELSVKIWRILQHGKKKYLVVEK